VNKFYLN